MESLALTKDWQLLLVHLPPLFLDRLLRPELLLGCRFLFASSKLQFKNLKLLELEMSIPKRAATLPVRKKNYTALVAGRNVFQLAYLGLFIFTLSRGF